MGRKLPVAEDTPRPRRGRCDPWATVGSAVLSSRRTKPIWLGRGRSRSARREPESPPSTGIRTGTRHAGYGEFRFAAPNKANSQLFRAKNENLCDKQSQSGRMRDPQLGTADSCRHVCVILRHKMSNKANFLGPHASPKGHRAP